MPDNLTICELHRENAMSYGTVRLWVQNFDAGRENVHYESKSGWPSLVTDQLTLDVDEKSRENRHFSASSLVEHFPQILRTVLYEVVAKRLARWVHNKYCFPKLLTQENISKPSESTLSFLTLQTLKGMSFWILYYCYWRWDLVIIRHIGVNTADYGMDALGHTPPKNILISIFINQHWMYRILGSKRDFFGRL